MLTTQKRFTLWQLMKGVMIAALVASALMPLTKHVDKILASPGLFLAMMVLALLIQAPLHFLPSFIDWLLDYKPGSPDEKMPK